MGVRRCKATGLTHPSPVRPSWRPFERAHGPAAMRLTPELEDPGSNPFEEERTAGAGGRVPATRRLEGTAIARATPHPVGPSACPRVPRGPPEGTATVPLPAAAAATVWSGAAAGAWGVGRPRPATPAEMATSRGLSAMRPRRTGAGEGGWHRGGGGGGDTREVLERGGGGLGPKSWCTKNGPIRFSKR